ncbi:MAG: GTPase HflX [Rubrobacter sp.]|nr:GTPase HflX [Rubrobacter sp.]
MIGKSEERAVLVGAGEERHLKELGRLAETLGVRVVGVLEQNRRDGSGYLGKGKREELAGLARSTDATLVLADDELTASQAKVLERDAGVSVADRTQLIIRIFEAHARDSASKLQVELAELEYTLPRARGMWTHLERQEGGGGSAARGATRGPGEQQIEYDRRVIREKMGTIRRKLEEEKAARELRGARLKEGYTPTVALVGYTNAGKTTILNALSGTSRSTKDWLFETLETTTRLVDGKSANGKGSSRPDFVVTDTVGFIRKLPTQLVESFASTLDAARDADIIVLCADASSEELEDEIRIVKQTLASVLEGDTYENPIILCLNKRDLLPESKQGEISKNHAEAILVSAIGGVEGLREEIYRRVESRRQRMELLIPHSEYVAASSLYGLAEIHSRTETTAGVRMEVTLPPSAVFRYEPYRVV